MTPTINVNLRPCGCPVSDHEAVNHHSSCAVLNPILIPCPIPRSVTFEVQAAPISACIFPCTWTSQYHRGPHHEKCPARPIRVSCSISGKRWKESDVTEVDPSRGPDGFRVTFREDAALAACRERWALAKALVLGEHPLGFSTKAEAARIDTLTTQRDAVYAALADMARAEDVTCAARDAVRKARSLPPSKPLARELRESAIELQDYVEHLIEQVGVLA